MKFIRVGHIILFAVAAILLCQCSMYREAILYPQVKDARNDFQNQDFISAVAKYDQLYQIHPDPDQKQTFLLQKGVALYLLHSHHDAEKTFRHYLRKYPDGRYRSEAEAYLTKIEALRAEKQRNFTLQREQLRGDVKNLKKMLKRAPYSPEIHYELANKLWELEDYDNAAHHYLKAGEIDAALKENELIRNRLIIDESGEAAPLTPSLQEEMERESHPLVIFDVHSYYQRNKPSYLGTEKVFRTVTGKVRNQSKRVLRNVRISVNFYNLRREILDVKTYYIGTMGPNEVRAFLVKGRNYDNLYNIEDFECQAYYQ